MINGLSNPQLVWPNAYPPLDVSGYYRAEPNDFRVQELLGFELDGTGEHLYYYLRKTNQNSHYLAEQLAKLHGVKSHAVGYSGRKDRIAITEQWFSVHLPNTVETPSLELADTELLEQTRHSKKLRTGAHQANRFQLRLQFDNPLSAAQQAALNERVALISQQGFPNYFGPQRFGHQGSNLTKALALGNRNLNKRQRQSSGMLLSSARSYVFNEILKQRIQQSNWQQKLAGEPDESITTGALIGDGANPVSGQLAELEHTVIEQCLAFKQLVNAQRMQWQRRPLVAKVSALSLAIEPDAYSAWLNFELPTGAFATSLLAELGLFYDRAEKDRQLKSYQVE